MKALVMAATLVVGAHFLFNGTPAFAQDVLLSRAETRAYHACLYAAWVEDNCRNPLWAIGRALRSRISHLHRMDGPDISVR